MPDTPVQKEYKLNIDPRILELLGPSLYTNIYYVLAELIANAYDAMAHNVYIISNKDDINVEDDGTGMSYENGDINHYLDVAKESRTTEEESLTADGKRKKMGRKGIGKLAALSVSENVLVKTRKNGEVSGFVLSRHIGDDSTLKAIPDDKISFQRIEGNGSAIVMTNPQYHLHKTMSVIKKNLIRIFPAISSDFRIHIIRGKEEDIVDSFDASSMNELCAIITLGDTFSYLGNLVMVDSQRRNDLVKQDNVISSPLVLHDKEGIEHEYTLEIAGWIGAYKSTRGRKAEISDFPDNFISLYANKKMGEFNILPKVGQNKLNEAYVVGQLHIDLFEQTELPDMALSNRQGYKSEDPRYDEVLKTVRDQLLPEILKLRELYSDIQNAEKNRQKEERQREKENELRQQYSEYKEAVLQDSSSELENCQEPLTQQTAIDIFRRHLNARSFDLGLKREVDSLKKKILISHTYDDKSLADIVCAMLVYNNVPIEDILYTNCEDERARIPEGEKVYQYLRDFFVDSLSTEKIYVLFITSENTQNSWGAITEIGAAWITQVDNKIFNIDPFRPKHPLDDELVWHTTQRIGNDLWMSPLDADIFCQKIEDVCKRLDYKPQSRENNKKHLNTLIEIKQ